MPVNPSSSRTAAPIDRHTFPASLAVLLSLPFQGEEGPIGSGRSKAYVRVQQAPEMNHQTRLHGGVVALRAAVLAAVLGFAAAGGGFISSDALLGHGHDGTGRSLLQAKKDCPVSFEGANYTVVTSRCKGPLYQPPLCCEALKDFACPYSTYINDPTNNCAATMFSYINLYGKYPPGLFANTCHEGDKGLKCPDDVPQVQPGQPASSAAAVATPTAAAGLAAAVAACCFLLMS